MLQQKLINIPTNLVMGFLGVGKTTAILDLLKQKPKNENWAVLVNEFGKVGIDGAIYSAAGVSVKEIAGGCLCCAVGLPFQTSLNMLLKETGPDRVLIELTGLGHPKKVLDMLLNNSFKNVLELRASISLVDPEKFKDSRYTTHENFIDQIALSDVLVANKMDCADRTAIQLFHHWVKNSKPEKALVAQTSQGQLDVAWLDIPFNPRRHAFFPNTHSDVVTKQHTNNNEADGYQSFGAIFPAENCFSYNQLSNLLSQLKVERIKGIIFSDKGWFIINSADSTLQFEPTSPSTNSRIEIISRESGIKDISSVIEQCKIQDR